MMFIKPLLNLNNSVYGCSKYLIVSRHPKGKLMHEIQIIYEDGTKLYFDTDSLYFDTDSLKFVTDSLKKDEVNNG